MKTLFQLTFVLFNLVLYAQNIDDNLLLNYNFDNDVTDSSPNQFDAVSNNIIFVDDRNGNPNSAAYFNGINAFLEMPNSSQLKPDFPISFSFWVNYLSSSVSDRSVFNTSFEQDRSTGVWFNATNTGGNFAINYGDGSPSYTPGTRKSMVSNSSISTNTWTHVAIVMTSLTDMRIYVDCQDLGGTYSGNGSSLVYSDNAGNIGRHDRDLGSSNEFFNGFLDDFRYWDRAISQSEIMFLCDQTLSSSDAGDIKNSLKHIISPNPANNHFQIGGVSNSTAIDVSIYNFFGQLMKKVKGSKNIDISMLDLGLYFVKITDKSSQTSISKLIKR